MRVRFNDLPHPVRERFVRVASATSPRDPLILAHNADLALGWFKYVTAVGALVAMGPILQFTISRGQTIDPIHDKEVYLGFAAAMSVFLLSVSAIAFRFLWKPPPFPAGLYVFPSCLVKASGGDLEIKPIVELGVPTIVTVRRNGSHVHTRLELGGPFSFYYPNDASAQAAWVSIRTARDAFRAMLDARDAAAIASVDPFVECTVSNAWVIPNQAPLPPVGASVPGALKITRWAGALFIGAATAGIYYEAVDTLFAESRAESRAEHDRPTKKPVKRRVLR